MIQNPEWQEAMWQPIIDARKHDVPIQYLANSQAPNVHLYLGVGEESRAAERGVAILGELGIKAAGVVLPFHHLEPTAANLDRTVKEAPIAVAEYINERGNRCFDAPVNLIGQSQGGGVALSTASEAPERFGDLGLIAPVGLTNNYLGESPAQRRRTFMRRLGISNTLMPSMSPLIDLGNLSAAREVSARLKSDIRARRLTAKLDYALGINLAETVPILSKDHAMRIFVGEKDKVFRPEELRTLLGRVGCEDLLEVVKGAHDPILNRSGARRMQHVGEWIKTIGKKV